MMRPAIRSRGLLRSALLLVGATAAACGPSSSPFEPARGLDTSLLPDTLAARYDVDAARLAVRYVRSRTFSPLPPVEIPETVRARFRDALVAVWWLDHPARDSVVELYGVHTFPRPALKEIIVGVKPGSALAAAWRSGTTVTGEEAADELIVRYELSLEHYHDGGYGRPWVVLRAAGLLDTAALAARFAAVRGVLYAEPNAHGGDGDDIRAREDGDSLILEYSVGFGDCPAGCIGRHIWSFGVTATAASFLGSSGDPLPTTLPGHVNRRAPGWLPGPEPCRM